MTLAAPIVGIVSLMMSGAYTAIGVYVGMLLAKYASACGQLSQTRSRLTLEEAMEAQQKFWKLAGILFLVIVGISVVSSIVLGLMVHRLAAMASQLHS